MAIWRNYLPEEIYAKVVTSTVEITTFDKNNDSIGLGSGFFIDNKGTIITNYHVIEDARYILVETADSKNFSVIQVIGFNRDLDIAILKINYENQTFLSETERTILTGETVYALGSSVGLTNTFSSGNISQVDRVVIGIEVLQITAPISPGNSGGPLLDIYGKVIGINSLSLRSGDNIYFSIKMSEVDKVNVGNPQTVEQFYLNLKPSFLMTKHFNANGVAGSDSSGNYREISFSIDANNSIRMRWYSLSEKLSASMVSISSSTTYGYFVDMDFDTFPTFIGTIIALNSLGTVIAYGEDDDALFSISSGRSFVVFDYYEGSSSLRSSYESLAESGFTLIIFSIDNYFEDNIGFSIID